MSSESKTKQPKLGLYLVLYRHQYGTDVLAVLAASDKEALDVVSASLLAQGYKNSSALEVARCLPKGLKMYYGEQLYRLAFVPVNRPTVKKADGK